MPSTASPYLAALPPGQMSIGYCMAVRPCIPYRAVRYAAINAKFGGRSCEKLQNNIILYLGLTLATLKYYTILFLNINTAIIINNQIHDLKIPYQMMEYKNSTYFFTYIKIDADVHKYAMVKILSNL